MLPLWTDGCPCPTPSHFTCHFTHLAQLPLAVLNKAPTRQHTLPVPFCSALDKSRAHIAKREFPHSPTTKFSPFVWADKSISRCYRKPTSIYKDYLLRFQTSWLSGCLAFLPRQKPLYCNLSQDCRAPGQHRPFYMSENQTARKKNTKLICFQMPRGRILSVRANLCLSCTDKIQHFAQCQRNVEYEAGPWC